MNIIWARRNKQGKNDSIWCVRECVCVLIKRQEKNLNTNQSINQFITAGCVLHNLITVRIPVPAGCVVALVVLYVLYRTQSRCHQIGMQFMLHALTLTKNVFKSKHEHTQR